MRARVTLTACVAMLTAAVAGAADVAPPPRAVDELWLPRPKPWDLDGRDESIDAAPRSAFSNLAFVRPLKGSRNSPRDARLTYQEKVDEA